MIHIKSQHKTNNHNALKKHTKQQPIFQTIPNIYQHYITANTNKMQTKHIITLIKLCYNHPNNQQQLTKLLNVPFLKGPITINPFPAVLLYQMQQHKKSDQEENQLLFLIQYLKSVKQNYFCWIIYFNENQKQLKLKLLKKDEIEENQHLFNGQLNLIGLFVHGRKLVVEEIENKEVLEEYYISPQNKDLLKSNASFNNSTGVTWKNMTNSKELFKNKHHEKSLSKLKITSFSPKLKITNKKSSIKVNQQSPYKKSFSVSSSIKLKSKSQTSLPIKRIKRQSADLQLKSICPQLFKINKAKSKVTKDTKIHKIASIYFKKTWKRCQN